MTFLTCWLFFPAQGYIVSERSRGQKVKMEVFWVGVLWTLKIWLYLIIGLIMIPAMFGFSLGISEAYMTLLVKTLEVHALAACQVVSPLSKVFKHLLRLFSCSAVGHSEDAEGPKRRAVA